MKGRPGTVEAAKLRYGDLVTLPRDETRSQKRHNPLGRDVSTDHSRDAEAGREPDCRREKNRNSRRLIEYSCPRLVARNEYGAACHPQRGAGDCDALLACGVAHSCVGITEQPGDQRYEQPHQQCRSTPVKKCGSVHGYEHLWRNSCYLPSLRK